MKTWATALLLALAAGCDATSTPGPGAPVAPDGLAERRPPPAESRPVAPPAVEQVRQGDLRFVRGYAPAAELARQSGKPILAFFTADWCHFCHETAASEFVDPEVVALAEGFVCALVDADAEARLCQGMRVRGLPTIDLRRADGTPLARLTGRPRPGELARHMRAAVAIAAGPKTARRR